MAEHEHDPAPPDHEQPDDEPTVEELDQAAGGQDYPPIGNTNCTAVCGPAGGGDPPPPSV